MADAGDPPPPLCPLCGHPTASASPTVSAASPAARPSLKRRIPPEAPPAVVRVEIGDEAAALREALSRQQAALADLQAELDQRGHDNDPAREKAEAMMEARQFRRYAEEKMSHDAAELAALEEALAKRDAAMRAVQQTPRHPASGASTPRLPCATPRPPASPSPGAPSGYYPALRCFIDHPPTASEADAQTPRDQLNRLAHRVHQLERAAPPTATTTPIIRVAPGSAFPRHARRYSDDSLDFCDGEFFPDDDEEDDADCGGASDRVYTVDAIHGGSGAPVAVPEGSCCGGTPAGSDCCGVAPWGMEDEEIRRLSSRLQALEADRETMRQAIINMGAEKAQVVLLKEIAQKLCKEAAATPIPAAVPMAQQNYYKGAAAPPAVTVTVRPPRHPPVLMQRRVVKKQPSLGASFFSVVKWVASIIWWRRKSSRIKYPMGQSGNNVGLLLLLDKAPRSGHGHQRLPKKI
ncbi:hypothetical protein ACP70R_031844 [Stipagrostis hirtigluma subsp. patula]